MINYRNRSILVARQTCYDSLEIIVPFLSTPASGCSFKKYIYFQPKLQEHHCIRFSSQFTFFVWNRRMILKSTNASDVTFLKILHAKKVNLFTVLSWTVTNCICIDKRNKRKCSKCLFEVKCTLSGSIFNSLILVQYVPSSAVRY